MTKEDQDALDNAILLLATANIDMPHLLEQLITTYKIEDLYSRVLALVVDNKLIVSYRRQLSVPQKD